MAAVLSRPRSPNAWVAIVARLIAVVAICSALVVRHEAGLVLVVVGGGLLLVPLAWRRRAPNVDGATYSVPADYFEPSHGKRLPGQLSLTETGVAWVPSRYSRSRGSREVVIDATGPTAITVERGTALLSVVVRIRASDGQEHRFGTRETRRLRQELGRLSLKGA
jgi:hypothetical protein